METGLWFGSLASPNKRAETDRLKLTRPRQIPILSIITIYISLGQKQSL
jgi:hypothetical protein